MEFELFMKSEEFKDFHDYFHCSRNNKYKFTKDKFETTLEYYQHMYNIKEIDINECLEIFKKHDIAISLENVLDFIHILRVMMLSRMMLLKKIIKNTMIMNYTMMILV